MKNPESEKLKSRELSFKVNAAILYFGIAVGISSIVLLIAASKAIF